MHEWTDWSIRLGRWRGIDIRVHYLFILMAVVMLGVAPNIGQGEMTPIAAISLGVLFISSLLHELAHVVAIDRLGGKVDLVVLGPFGGVTRCSLPPPPESVCFAALAGPVVNGLVAIAGAIVLLFATSVGVWGALGLFHPIAPAALIEGSSMLVAAKLFVWVNWLISLLNVLPAFPFDGGMALRAVLRPVVGSRTAIEYTFRTAIGVAVALLVTAWFVRELYAQAAIPAWLPLAMLALFLMVSAKRDRALASLRVPEDDPFGEHLLDNSDDLLFEELEDDVVLIESWRNPSREEHKEGGEQDDNEEARLDDVLARLHHSSIDQLSPEDRQLLERASEKYRDRLQTPGPENVE